MIALSDTERASVQAVLSRIVPGREVKVFGSRARGWCKPHSDLDLVVMGDMPLGLSDHARLDEAFEEAGLPFRVDVVAWASLAPAFREAIAPDLKPLV